ncbi:MAG: hypothetical protein A2015_00930 [Spirochaetes bacterium GWF1_31_7]|nr:MAG: hypothetical protein A2Y30_12790 [Spirochaetes bacterium GWE1_32_154]OHD51683.1 MAG: hypothetical protein A2Y29_04590 [Spirochaetes bacterium GWE2_31_10]OHD51935.1 MAG: hypothetical protein A2015_00930 [Spirochaetes bacterium GWF1_31_7]OHD76091.1 MAG: hypothetical protein A2355_10060 [Spirochaetes bacterium RIFOXYB1_FULL_32_8]
MKANVMVLFLLIGLALNAKDGYITARMCSVHTQPDSGSDKLGILKQAQKVTIVSNSGEWMKIKTDTFEGFVNSRFIGDQPAIVLASVADGRKDMANVDVRKRASTYTSSAAAIRGLSSENVRERENVAFNDYDFNSIKWIETNFSFSSEEVISFSLTELN